MKNLRKLGLACMAVMMATVTVADQLYETGPSEDSSFVRFVNASEDKVQVVNGAAQIALDNQGDGRASKFFPVKQGSKLSATVQVGKQKLPVQVTAKPGEFITIAVVGKEASAKVLAVRETPTDFNAMRSSLALTNLDEKCTNAALTGGAKNASIVEGVKPSNVQRRLVNPVKLTVQVQCDGKPAGDVLDLSQLQAGERYSVFMLSLKSGRQSFFVRDSNL
jgi:alginate O-acetyltransferase complex protein AlgF